jgi:hypothetical protein
MAAAFPQNKRKSKAESWLSYDLDWWHTITPPFFYLLKQLTKSGRY